MQYNFLLADLARVDRRRTPWVVVITHCPWYNSNTAHKGEWQALNMRANLEGLFRTHGVNAVFAGHVHAYERSKGDDPALIVV